MTAAGPATPAGPTPPARNTRRTVMNLVMTVVFSIVLPIVTYDVLAARGVSEVVALIVSGV